MLGERFILNHRDEVSDLTTPSPQLTGRIVTCRVLTPSALKLTPVLLILEGRKVEERVE